MKPISLSALVSRLRTPVQSGDASLAGIDVKVHSSSHKDGGEVTITGFALDSRHVKPGFAFLAFQGDNCHGLDFAEQAIASGACLAISEPGYDRELPIPLLEIPDLRQGLRHLATAEQVPAPGKPKTVAVTGSVGKTTTCQLGSALSSSLYSTHSPRNSFNNFLGVPITILEASAETEVLWLEMGTNEPGEISGLAAMGQPDIAVVTAVGATHLEKLQSTEGVFREKFSLFDQAGIQRAVAPIQYRFDSMPVPCWWTGPGGDVEIQPIISLPGRYRFEHRPQGLIFEFETTLQGTGSLRCLESAITVALELGIPVEKIRASTPLLELPRLRQELYSIDGVELVLDCYNASPPSVEGAIADLSSTSASRKMAVLGTMEELGADEAEYHRQMGQACANAGLDHLWCVGRGAQWLHEGAQSAGGASSILSRDDHGLACLLSELQSGDRVLFKASRKEALESLAHDLKNRMEERLAMAKGGPQE